MVQARQALRREARRCKSSLFYSKASLLSLRYLISREFREVSDKSGLRDAPQRDSNAETSDEDGGISGSDVDIENPSSVDDPQEPAASVTSTVTPLPTIADLERLPSSTDLIFDDRSEIFKQAYDRGTNLWNELNRNLVELPTGIYPDFQSWHIHERKDVNPVLRYGDRCTRDGILYAVDQDEDPQRSALEDMCSKTYKCITALTKQGLLDNKQSQTFVYKNCYSS